MHLQDVEQKSIEIQNKRDDYQALLLQNEQAEVVIKQQLTDMKGSWKSSQLESERSRLQEARKVCRKI